MGLVNTESLYKVRHMLCHWLCSTSQKLSSACQIKDVTEIWELVTRKGSGLHSLPALPLLYKRKSPGSVCTSGARLDAWGEILR